MERSWAWRREHETRTGREGLTLVRGAWHAPQAVHYYQEALNTPTSNLPASSGDASCPLERSKQYAMYVSLSRPFLRSAVGSPYSSLV